MQSSANKMPLIYIFRNEIMNNFESRMGGIYSCMSYLPSSAQSLQNLKRHYEDVLNHFIPQWNFEVKCIDQFWHTKTRRNWSALLCYHISLTSNALQPRRRLTVSPHNNIIHYWRAYTSLWENKSGFLLRCCSYKTKFCECGSGMNQVWPSMSLAEQSAT